MHRRAGRSTWRYENASLGQLGFDDRLVPGPGSQLHVAGASPKVLHHALRSMEVAVEHDDALEPLGDEAEHDRPGAAAGAEDHGPARHLLPADEVVKAGPEARHVGVVPDEALALLGDRVHGAGRVGLLSHPVDERHDPLLVRDRDLGAQVVGPSQPLDRAGQLGHRHVEQLVARVDASRIEGGLQHRPGQGVGHRMPDQHDAPAHTLTRSSSSKKPGYEIVALSGRRTTVSPRAMRPPTANAIARRWSPRLSATAPRRRVRPLIRISSPRTSTSAPSAARPAAIPASRSDSLWRSSPAPRMTVVPRAWVAARQRIGISSMAAATSAGVRSIASWAADPATRSAVGSATPASGR